MKISHLPLACALTLATLPVFATPALATPADWVTNYGSLVVSGDDSTAAIHLPFAFTLGNTTYSSATVSTNGFMQFGGSIGSACCGSTVHELENTYPTIAGVWADLVGAVYQNNLADSTVLTWTSHEYGSGQNEDFQIRLYEDGNFSLAYDVAQPLQTHYSVAGVAAISGLNDPGSIDLSAASDLTTGTTAYQFFGANQLDLVNSTLFFTRTATGYSISTSGFLASAVPEPGAWALMLVGIGAIGAVLRARPRSLTRPRAARMA